jgi:hypothetical protein
MVQGQRAGRGLFEEAALKTDCNQPVQVSRYFGIVSQTAANFLISILSNVDVGWVYPLGWVGFGKADT